MLGTLLKVARDSLGEAGSTIEVVSVYAGDSGHQSKPSLAPAAPTPLPTARPSACVWVSARDAQRRFMNPLKLQGLLALHTSQVSQIARYIRLCLQLYEP